MKRFACLSVLSVLVLCAALSGPGCSPSSGGGGKAPVPPNAPAKAEKAGPYRIALVMKSLANEFFLTMENGAKAHQQQHASEYTLISNGIKDEQDVARQIDLVEQMVAQEVDALVIAPADSKALVGVCKRAQDAGVVVINIDNKFDDSVLKEKNITIPFVGPDNRKGAKLAADYLAKKLEPGAPVAILEGIPSAFNGQQRKLGFDDAIAAAGLKLVTSQSAGWEMDKANQVASSILTEHPEIKALLCANDSMALGAAAAVRAAGKTGQVLLCGYDGISAVENLVRDGQVVCTVQQYADKLAVFGIEYALQVLRDKTTPQDKETALDLVTAETAAKK